MTVSALAILAMLSWAIPGRYRASGWLALSIGALYALQPPGADFATVTLVIILGVWWIIRAAPLTVSDQAALGIGATTALSMAVLQGSAASLLIGLALVAVSGTTLTALIPPIQDESGTQRRLAVVWIGVLILLLAVFKTPALLNFSRAALAVPSLSAFGFSYIAFRLMHTLIDYRNGRLPTLSLRDFALYVIFFPTLSAGPIDRVQHFITQLGIRPFEWRYIADGAQRILWGMFRKFIIADGLAYIALSPALVNVLNKPAPTAYWLMLYAYAFYIFFDFAGYTDIAIGIGLLLGVRLPENFRRPYMRPNIAAFWNSWHITLSSWYRDYVFTPLSRSLLKAHWSPWLAAFTAQVLTMILIGLWHGVSLNFIAWGAWHGLGLYLHRLFAPRFQPDVADRPRLASLIRVSSVLVTFHFVAFGWVFFALPDLQSSLRVFAGLIGLR